MHLSTSTAQLRISLTLQNKTENWREPEILTILNAEKAKYKWSITRKAAMAAEMAVESTAQETDLTEDSQVKVEHSEATAQEDHSVKAEIAQEEHLERAATVLEDHLEKAQKEKASAEIVQEDRSVRTLSVQEEHSEIIQREEASEATVREDHSARTQREASIQIVQEDHSVRTLTVQEDHLVRTLREEASVEESQQEEAVSTQQRRASTRRISAISAMRMRAESTR